MNHPRIFVLDDSISRIREFALALAEFPITLSMSSADAVEKLLTNEPFDFVFLDHDLGGMAYVDSSDEETGAEVVRRVMAEKPSAFGDTTVVIIHSLNRPGAEHMASLLPYAPLLVPFHAIDWETLRKDIRLYKS